MILLLLTGLAFGQEAQVPTTNESGDFVITGEVLKPEVTVVISRENLNKAYELDLRESFLEKIIQSVEEPPF